MLRWQIIVGVVVAAVVLLVVIIVPTMMHVNTIIPGLNMIPEDPIIYKNADVDLKYVDILDDFIRSYEGIPGVGSQFVKQCSEHDGPITTGDTTCVFRDTWISNRYCSKNEEWGYSRSSPCVILRPNKVEDWVPLPYESLDELPANMPTGLKTHIHNTTQQHSKVPQMLWVWCEGDNPADKEYAAVKMSPWYGFPLYYFPYRNIPQYMQPLIGVQFTYLQFAVVVNMKCRLWSKDIDPDENPLTFQILMD